MVCCLLGFWVMLRFVNKLYKCVMLASRGDVNGSVTSSGMSSKAVKVPKMVATAAVVEATAPNPLKVSVRKPPILSVSSEPSVWEKWMSPQGHPYFYNVSTGESSWEQPLHYKDKTVKSAKAAIKSISMALSPTSKKRAYDENEFIEAPLSPREPPA